MKNRIKDWLRELRIKRLKSQYTEAMITNKASAARMHWVAMRDEIKERSPAQVSRMEKKMGVRV